MTIDLINLISIDYAPIYIQKLIMLRCLCNPSTTFKNFNQHSKGKRHLLWRDAHPEQANNMLIKPEIEVAEPEIEVPAVEVAEEEPDELSEGPADSDVDETDVVEEKEVEPAVIEKKIKSIIKKISIQI